MNVLTKHLHCCNRRQVSTLVNKVPASKGQKNNTLRIPWKHKFVPENVMSKYFDVPKSYPALIYDFTDDLQLVKPYLVNVQNNISKKIRSLSLYDYKMKTTTGPIPRSFKSQFVSHMIESKGVIMDDKVYTTGTSPLAKHSFIRTQHHAHELPVPKINPRLLKPSPLSGGYKFVDKPAGFPCIPDLRHYAYNSLQFMLYVHKHVTAKSIYLHNDLGFASGVVLFAKDAKKAYKLANLQQHGEVKFVYLVRVHGRLNSSISELSDGSDDSTIKAKVSRLQYDTKSDTSLLRLECYEHSLQKLRMVLSQHLHPIVNDWKHVAVHGGYLTNSLTVEFANQSRSLFSGKKLIQDASHFECEIMRNPLVQNKDTTEDYVIKPRHLNLSPELENYYNQYISVIRSQEKVQHCADCLVTRLPLPINLMAPQIHLSSVETPEFSCKSKQRLDWM